MTMVNTKNGPRANEPFAGWFRYPAGFSASTLDACVEAVSHKTTDVVVADPFQGVATVGHRALREGWAFVGIEAHPLIAHIASLKFRRHEDVKDLVVEAKRIARVAGRPSGNREHELVRRTFAPEMLSELVGLRNAIRRSESPWRDHLELALVSNLRDHANVKVGWPYQLPRKRREPASLNPRRRFVERAARFARDLESAPPAKATVICGDARTNAAWRKAAKHAPSAVISSPPYLNNFDYADATRLELYFLGEVSTWKEMCDSVRAGLVVASTQQAHQRPAEEALAALEELPALHKRLAPAVTALDMARRERGRRWGKQYHWLVSLYFRDLHAVFEHMRQALPSGSPVAFVVGDSAPYGIYLDTPGLLSVMAQELGFEERSSRVLRSRGLRWRTNGSRHQVPLCERLVVWRAPGSG